MARTVVYPSANITVNHTGSGYSSISDARGEYDTTAISHSFAHNRTTSLTSSFRAAFKSQDSTTPTGKFIIRRITGGQTYTRLVTNGGSSQTATTVIAGSLEGGSFVNGSSKTVTTSQDNFESSSFTISGLTGSNRVYESIADADVRIQLRTKGMFVSYSKYDSANFRISAINLDLEYDNVYSCQAVVVQGYGISAATPSQSVDIVEGSTCSFSATLEPDVKFLGWYENADFSGDPISTSRNFNPTVESNLTLYPKGELPYPIQIFSDSSMSDKFSYTITVNGESKTTAFEGDTVTVKVTVLDDLYKFAGIYKADSEGYKLSEFLSSSATYTFTMEAAAKYMYVVLGKEIRIYVNCQNCTLVGATSPIVTVAGRTETVEFTFDSSTYDWSGIYSDARYTSRLTQDQSYTFLVGDNDIYLYARAIGKQQIYIKENGVWQTYSEVYVKENGVWVKKEDFTDVFDTSKHYRKM